MDTIAITPADQSWPAQFDAEAAAIQSELGQAFVYAIHHVGSTAVPGLAAKPIIDIVLEVADRECWSLLIEPLQRIGYVYWDQNPDEGEMFFVKGMPPFGTGRTHHIHVLAPDAIGSQLRFRDYLIAHPDEAARYERLKRELAVRLTNDRDGYTKAKSEFVEHVLRKVAEAKQKAPPDTRKDAPGRALA
ncbi:MAG: GrpB family protein [Acidobacteriia bacterium]|nr:GrpB family protein [Terriglobia bacterium]